MKVYETLSEAINDLAKRGYVNNFNIKENRIECSENNINIHPDDFEIDEVYRFQQMSDPDDESILYAISSNKHNMKGVLVNAFGIYSDTASTELVEKLKSKLK